MSSTARESRWNLRIARDEDEVVRRAAEESELDLSDFVRSAALKEADRVLADRTRLQLDGAQWKRFMELVDRPARVPAGLEDLFSRPNVFE